MTVVTTLTFGDLIRQHRNKAQLSLSELASLSNVNKATISRIESGEVKKPEFKTLKAIAEALQIPYETYLIFYIETEQSPNVIHGILEDAIKDMRPIATITQIAIKFLESERLDSYDATEQLFNSTQSLDNSELKLSLHQTIINYCRGRGVVPFLARSLCQVYFIERNEFSKLKDTYQSGKYVLKYKEQLPPGEYITLLYCLAVHAFVIREYLDAVKYSKAVLISNEEEAIAVRAYMTDLLRGSHYYLGNYDLAEKYAEEYRKCVPSVEGDNDRLLTAMINAKRGKLDLAVEQFEKSLQLCDQKFVVHIVPEYISLCFELGHINKIQNLLVTYESKILAQTYTTPMERSDVARFYKLKGDYYSKVNDINQAVSEYIEGAYAYACIDDVDNERESLRLVFNIGKLPQLSADVIEKISNYYNRFL
ncbi:helix-turn-helix domain-containing protein [Paenibacillus agilis]|uniref:Helix-turn-helix transcriptional regulator n=1 Tax=Paenibacillus agilis TaxID=3020863 RepID=A0A559ID24_9BACL|nr:helix-turn-helix transcriptional regulator [Paenibacillus agilis]TVX85534.1 helix-turn-helix transcriptional regulator [Paenibacillus agilis]